MSPSTTLTRPIRFGVAWRVALITAGITAGCLYDSTGPDALLTEEEMRRLFMQFTHGLFQAERDSTLFGRQPGFGCSGISFGNLDSERSNDTTIAFTYRATPKDCGVRNGPDNPVLRGTGHCGGRMVDPTRIPALPHSVHGCRCHQLQDRGRTEGRVRH